MTVVLIMLALSAAYDALGAFAVARHAFHGIGPVVVGIFAVAVYRLGRATIRLIALWVLAALFAADALAARELAMPVWFDAPMQQSGSPNLWGLSVFFFKVGALTFRGGLSMLAFIQDPEELD